MATQPSSTSSPGTYRPYFLAIVLLVLSLLLYLWGHIRTMAQGEELHRLRQERVSLLHRQERLQTELAGLKHSRRIRRLASEKLGMVFPSEPPRNLYLQPGALAQNGNAP